MGFPLWIKERVTTTTSERKTHHFKAFRLFCFKNTDLEIDYHGVVIKPPLKVRASQIFSRGFIISQKFWNVSFGVLLFSENFADFGHFSDTFWIIFEAFSPCKTAKSAHFFFARASARGFTLKSYFEAFLDLFVEHFPLVNS